MKYLVISIIILALLFAGAAAWVFWPQGEVSGPQAQNTPAGSSAPNYQSSVSVPPAGQDSSAAEPEWKVVPAADGTGIRVNDFMATRVEEETGGDVYLAGSRNGTDRYRITYHVPLETFAVFLLAEPLKETRELAEQDLLRILGISESDACRLRYFVSLPEEVNPLYAGLDLGFSFCAESTPL